MADIATVRSMMDGAPVYEPASSYDGYAEQVTSRRRFQLVPFDQITFTTARNYVVKGLIPANGLVVAWGAPKCGKSFLVSSIALHVALGWPWRGKRVQAGPVVYVAAEGAEGFRARIAAFRQEFATGDRNVPFYLVPTGLDLVGEHEQLAAAISDTIKDAQPVLIVLDTLNRTFRGSESSDEDMTAYIASADALRIAFGCAVLVVHHCRIDGTRPRGHTSLTGAVDAQIAVKKDEAGLISATVEYMKDGPEGETFASRLRVVALGEDEDGDPITSCVIEPTDEQSDAAPRVRGAAAVALEMLRRAIADAGEVLPASRHYPDKTLGVKLDLWRAYCSEGGLTTADTPDAKRKAFVRATQTLRERQIIGIWGDFVWIA